VLVTSRIALRLIAEQQFPVPPLALLPMGDAFPSHPGAAVELFAARARAASPSFQLDPGSSRTAAAICARLDGLPLAIELAAAHTSVLPPAALLARLGHRLDSLALGMRDLPDRQRTLRATIAWSYDLLGDAERALFRRLAVFAGGCTLAAAEAIGDPGGEHDILAGVAVLAEHSLLRRAEAAEPWHPADMEPRLAMLETLREYATELLEASGEAEEFRRRHAEYYLQLAESAASELKSPAQAAWLARLEAEHDNLRATLAWARERADAGWGLRLAAALGSFWYLRGHLSEGRGWLGDFLALPCDDRDDAPARAWALVGLANLAYLQADYNSAAAAASEAASIARPLGDGPNLAMALNILGAVARNRSDFGQAAAWFEEELALARSTGDRWYQATALHMLAEMARCQGDHGRATALAAESAILFDDLGDHWGLAQALAVQGNSARDCGATEEGAALLEESLAIARDLGHTRDIAQALAGLGDIARMWGDVDGAAALLEESLALLEPLGDRRRQIRSLTALGQVCRAQGDGARATAHYRESLELCRAIGDRLGVAENLEGLAGVIGPAVRAAQLLAAAATLRTALGAPLPPASRAGHMGIVSELRAALGDKVFASAWAAGTAAPLEAAIVEALKEEIARVSAP
jgi:predicted ATPase